MKKTYKISKKDSQMNALYSDITNIKSENTIVENELKVVK